MPSSPNMGLPISTVGIDSGLNWELNLNSSLFLLDAHDHSPGKGVPINSASINISTDLPINNNNLTLLHSVRFQPQSSALSGPADLGCIYEAGVDLWYNDGNGNQIQLTAGGTVNATSSGISSGTNTASFVSNVLVVNASSNHPANIQGASLLMGNNSTGTNYLTLSPPSAMPANYGLVLPSLPSVQSIMALDTSGNITAPYTVDNSTIVITSNVIQVPTSGITDLQVAPHTLTIDKQNLMTASSSAAPSSGLIQSASSGAYTNSTSTQVLIFASATIATNGRPLFIGMCGDLGGSVSFIRVISLNNTHGSPTGSIFIYVDGVLQNSYVIQALSSGAGVDDHAIPPSTVSMLVPIGAGTHTVAIYGAAQTTGLDELVVNDAMMVAYEI